MKWRRLVLIGLIGVLIAGGALMTLSERAWAAERGLGLATIHEDKLSYSEDPNLGASFFGGDGVCRWYSIPGSTTFGYTSWAD